MPKQGKRRAPVLRPDDPATVWSTWIQPVEILDVTREYRFRDEVRGILWPVLGLKPGGVVVDVGCGSGILTRVLARWMGAGSMVYGVDCDANFIAFATEGAKQERLSRRTRYVQGDALSLPLPDRIADAVTSYTVIEHIPDHLAFVHEQMRVCKPGGRVSIMEVWPKAGISAASPWACGQTEREKELWKPMEEPGKALVDRPWKVGRSSVDGLYGLVALLEQAGLTEIVVDGFSTVTALDDARVSLETAERRVRTEERMYLDNADRFSRLVSPPLPAGHLPELKRLIRARFAKRLHYLRAGKRIWDWGIGTNAVVSGRVPR